MPSDEELTARRERARARSSPGEAVIEQAALEALLGARGASPASDPPAGHDAATRSESPAPAPPPATGQKRRSPWTSRGRLGAGALAALAVLAAVAILPVSPGDPPAETQAAASEAASETSLAMTRAAVSNFAAPDLLETVPSRSSVAVAEQYAARRGGLVSFAAVDSEGRLIGSGLDQRYVSASVVKSMLLAAELDRLEAEGLPLDSVTRDTLTRMITYSDNAAADEIYYRVGDAGLYAVAERLGMERFTVSGYWANAEITAGDMALMFSDLDTAYRGPEADFARGLLGSIVPEQSWGVPDGVGKRFDVRFKGGWRTTELGWLVHQAAELRRDGEKISLAVLTDAQPSMEYAIETLEGISARLIADPTQR